MDKRTLMVYGHEIWLERVRTDVSAAVEIALLYGDRMKKDGCIDPLSVSAVAFGPCGEKIVPEILCRGEECLVVLSVTKHGFYESAVYLNPVTISISQSKGARIGPRKMYRDTLYAGTFHQMAKIIIPVGEPGQYYAQHLQGILDIIPERAWIIPGSDVRLTLLYEGRPVPGVTICAISKNDGNTWTTVKTGPDGIARLQIPATGVWMFITRFRDRQKRCEYEYDETVFVTTLVMEAVQDFG